jgi:formylglycine-generating enzyme required for sulfatase activity
MKNGAVGGGHAVAALCLMVLLSAGCGLPDTGAPAPVFETGASTSRWAPIPAGEFYQGQHEHVASLENAYEVMVYLVTNAQYAEYLNEALAAGMVKLEGDTIVGFYPGDTFRGARHEEPIDAGNYPYLNLNAPALRIVSVGTAFNAMPTWETHPMSMVTWFGARAFCAHYGWRLPTELEWEKAARGAGDARPFPWGDEIARNNANYYASRDPFEDMGTYGSRTTPVGFYNGRTYDGYTTVDSPSPYGLYDMAGNVWQWTGDVYPFEHYRYLRGGSKDTYDIDLRIWVRNSATPLYASPGAGFRCAR